MALELEVWQAPIVDSEGNIQPGAQVTVFNSDDTIATIYDDLNRTPRSNPFNVGSDALARFYAEPGRYRVQAQVGSGIAVFDDVDLSQKALREDLSNPGGARLVLLEDGRNLQEYSEQFSDEALQQAVADAQSEADRAETAAEQAAAAGLVYESSAAGQADSELSGGDYFFVVSADSDEVLELWRKGATSPTDTGKRTISNRINNLSVNSGKEFPLKPIVRDGETSPSGSRNYNDFLLDVKVVASREFIDGYYFRIGYFQNDRSVGGAANKGVQIQRLPIDTYSTASEAEIIHNHTDTPIDFERGSGIQTVVIQAERVPGDVKIYLTIDTDKVYPAGDFINSQNANDNSGSWIIDTSRYFISDAAGYDSLTINSMKPYPFAAANRGGVVSVENADFSAFILDVEIVNAIPGKLYKISYYQNGAAGGYGWIIQEFDKDLYDTEASAVRIEDRDADYEIDKTKGIQDIRIIPSNREGMLFIITVDGTKVPETGTVTSLNASMDGWSWIVDESCYRYITDYPTDYPTLKSDLSGLSFSMQGDNVFAWWLSGDTYYRMEFGPNGVNSLPNVRSIAKSDDGEVWEVLSSASTDWLPPIQVEAISDGDGSERFYTGGNHSSDGSGTGTPSAINRQYQCFAGGNPINDGSEGVCDEVSIVIVNDVMGFNTASFGRYIMRETFRVIIRPGGAYFKSRRQALEPIRAVFDNGIQTVTQGFQGTQLFYGGPEGRGSFDSTANSGEKQLYPEAWAVVLQDSENGQLTTWIDRDYGAGDGQFVGDTSPLIRFGGGSNTKLYGAAVRISPNPVFQTGEFYGFAGGWSLQSISLQPAEFDSYFQVIKDELTEIATAVDNADWWRV